MDKSISTFPNPTTFIATYWTGVLHLWAGRTLYWTTVQTQSLKSTVMQASSQAPQPRPQPLLLSLIAEQMFVHVWMTSSSTTPSSSSSSSWSLWSSSSLIGPCKHVAQSNWLISKTVSFDSFRVMLLSNWSDLTPPAFVLADGSQMYPPV